jgi:hypothetical protein
MKGECILEAGIGIEGRKERMEMGECKIRNRRKGV